MVPEAATGCVDFLSEEMFWSEMSFSMGKHQFPLLKVKALEEK